MLFAEIVRQLEGVNATGHLNIEHRTKLCFGDMDQTCILGMNRLGMTVVWYQRYSNTVSDHAALIVREFNENVVIPPGQVHLLQPEMLKEEKYDPDISRAREYVWRRKRNPQELLTSRDLATNLLLQFLDLVERDCAGKIKRKGWG